MMPGENLILAAYLVGWKDSRQSLLDTLAHVPDDRLADVVRAIRHEQEVYGLTRSHDDRSIGEIP